MAKKTKKKKAGRPAGKLTDKQLAFVQEYIVDFNATQAAIRAKYSKATAGQAAARLLKNVKIQRSISEAIDARAKRMEVTQDYVLGKLLENVERSMQTVKHLDQHGNANGEFKYNGAVANKALELLGKHLGMWTEKIDVNMTGIDYSTMTDDQLKRLREGEDARIVIGQS